MNPKTHRASRPASQGNVLFATLVIIGVVGIALASYLSLIQNRAEMAARSQSWNMCVPLGEAGLEEAMAHLNQTRGVGLYSNGWTLVAASGVYSKQVSLSAGHYYVATISTGSPPVVESAGFARAPTRTNYISRRFRLITENGNGVRGIVARAKSPSRTTLTRTATIPPTPSTAPTERISRPRRKRTPSSAPYPRRQATCWLRTTPKSSATSGRFHRTS